MEELEDKITKASESTNARFKRKKIRSMKREAHKIAEKLRESEATLKSLESRIPKDPISGAPLKRHPPNKNKCIDAKIVELNKKIRRAKNRRNKECLIAKRNSLRLGPRLLEGAFGNAYRRYIIDGINPRNEDQECFKWAVIAAMRWGEIDSHSERISNLARFEADFYWSRIEFPVSII